MTARTADQEFSVTGPRNRLRGETLSREADEIAGIRARQAKADEWTHTYVGGTHTGGADNEIEHRYVLHLTFL